MGYFIHAANVLYLVSYLVRDILWLRLLTVVAALTLMPYFYFQPQVLWPPILWNVLFIAINIYQIHQLLRERRPVELSAEQQQLYSLAFAALTPRQFKRLAELARAKQVGKGERLVTRGAEVDEVMVIASGEVAVRSGDVDVALLEPGCLVGEMAYVSGRVPSADVVAVTDGVVYVWKHRELDRLFEKYPELRGQWQGIVIGDLTSKLRRG